MEYKLRQAREVLAEVGKPAGSWGPGAIPKALLHKVWSPDQQQWGSLF